MNTTGLIEIGWAAIVPESNLYWHELPPGTVMEWLADLGELAHRHVDIVPVIRDKEPAEKVDVWFATMASMPVTAAAMTRQRLFALCADLRIWHMELAVPRTKQVQGGEEIALDLEEWASAHLQAASTIAFRAMIDALLALSATERSLS